MNRYVYIILAVLGFNTVLAQETIIPLKDGGIFNEEPNTVYYYKDVNNDLNKFLGTWLYDNGTVSFTIIFKMLNHKQSGTGDFYDELYAKIKYINNGQIIYDNLNEINYLSSDISGAGLNSTNTNNISLVYNEPSNIPVTSIPTLNLEYIPCLVGTNCEQLIWHNSYLKNTADEPWPFVIPVDMVLIRQ